CSIAPTFTTGAGSFVPTKTTLFVAAVVEVVQFFVSLVFLPSTYFTSHFVTLLPFLPSRSTFSLPFSKLLSFFLSVPNAIDSVFVVSVFHSTFGSGLGVGAGVGLLVLFPELLFPVLLD